MRPDDAANDSRGVAAAAVAVLLFASGNILVKGIDVPGLQLATWRLGLAAVLYVALYMVRGGGVTVAGMKRTFLPGVLFALNLVGFYLAVKRTTVANATIIGSLQPLFIVGFVSRRFGEVIEKWLAFVAPIAIIGTALVILGSSGEVAWSPLGDGLALGSTILWTGYFASAKKARETIGVLELQAFSLVWGVLIAVPAMLLDGSTGVPSGTNLLWIMSLVLLPGTGHALMNWAHAHIELSLASLLTLAIPALGVVGAYIFLDEAIVPLQVLGMAIVLTALAYTIRRTRSEA